MKAVLHSGTNASRALIRESNQGSKVMSFFFSEIQMNCSRGRSRSQPGQLPEHRLHRDLGVCDLFKEQGSYQLGVFWHQSVSSQIGPCWLLCKLSWVIIAQLWWSCVSGQDDVDSMFVQIVCLHAGKRNAQVCVQLTDTVLLYVAKARTNSVEMPIRVISTKSEVFCFRGIMTVPCLQDSTNTVFLQRPWSFQQFVLTRWPSNKMWQTQSSSRSCVVELRRYEQGLPTETASSSAEIPTKNEWIWWQWCTAMLSPFQLAYKRWNLKKPVPSNQKHEGLVNTICASGTRSVGEWFTIPQTQHDEWHHWYHKWAFKIMQWKQNT